MHLHWVLILSPSSFCTVFLYWMHAIAVALFFKSPNRFLCQLWLQWTGNRIVIFESIGDWWTYSGPSSILILQLNSTRPNRAKSYTTWEFTFLPTILGHFNYVTVQKNAIFHDVFCNGVKKVKKWNRKVHTINVIPIYLKILF